MVVIEEFSDENPLTYEKLNATLGSLVGLVNSLAGEQVAQLGAVSGDGQFARLSGAKFLGQVAAPSVLIGPSESQQYPAVTTNDFATGAAGGVVLRAAYLADLSQVISNPPTQVQVQAIQAAINSLQGAMRTAKQMATS